MNALICSNWRPEFQAKHAGPALSSVTLTPTDVSQGLVWYNHSSRFQLVFGLVLKTTDDSQGSFGIQSSWSQLAFGLVLNTTNDSQGLVWYNPSTRSQPKFGLVLKLQMTVSVWFGLSPPPDLRRILVWYSNYSVWFGTLTPTGTARVWLGTIDPPEISVEVWFGTQN
jgi:hypothetical protein